MEEGGETLGEVLARHRTRQGLSQPQLAEAARVSEDTIASIESGKTTTPQRVTIGRLAKALGLEGDELSAFENLARKRPARDTQNNSQQPDPIATSRPASALRWILLIPVVLLLGGLLALWQWDRRNQEGAIEQAILDATTVELDWYKHPNEEHRDTLLQYFLPPEQGGDRLPRIEFTIERLKQQNRRFALDASKSVSVESISMHLSGRSATVKTTEVWYQPLLESSNGVDRRIDRQDELGRHPLYAKDTQQYTLKRQGNRWLIESNPVV